MGMIRTKNTFSIRVNDVERIFLNWCGKYTTTNWPVNTSTGFLTVVITIYEHSSCYVADSCVESINFYECCNLGDQ